MKKKNHSIKEGKDHIEKERKRYNKKDLRQSTTRKKTNHYK